MAVGPEAADLYRIRTLAEPRISPDGQRVVYTVRQANERTNTTDSDLWMVPLAGGSPRQLTWSGGAIAPQWSPDGRLLAYLAPLDGKKQVFALPFDGGAPYPLTRLDGGVTAFSWSPSGDRLACVSLTGRPREATATLHYRTPAYKFDGAGFFDERRSRIWLVPLEGRRAVPLTSDPEANDASPQWSPDGKRIAFVRTRNRGALPREQSLFTVTVASGVPVEVLGPKVGVQAPVWSPDGRRIAFIGSEDAVAIPLVWIWQAGSAPVPVTRKFTYPDALAWAADGRTLLVSANWRGRHPIFRMDVDRGEWREQEGSVSDWDSHAGRGALVCVRNSTTQPDELFSSGRPLTAHNREYVATVRLAALERFSFQGADGWDIDAFLLPPIDRVDGRKYPLIVAVHGGPNGMWGEEWSLSAQVLAAAGWGVLLTNPRGSSGYGEVFQRGVNREWGGKAYQDVQAGVDAALARHAWLDAGKLGITGWSYGGFMTNWTVTQTTRFQAAVSISGISNFLSVEGTRDGHYGHTRDFGGDLWAAYDLYWHYSSVRQAAAVKTPVLLLHGAADQRVPLEQSEQWFRALQHFEVPSELVILPGEPHVMRREPRHEVEVQRWLIYWFRRFLDGETHAKSPHAQ